MPITSAATVRAAASDVHLYHADCRDALRALPDDCIDSVVTDPPYALVSIVKRFGSPNAAPTKGNDAYMRASAGFMGKTWDTGEVAFDWEFWREVLRVLKPGGHVCAFGASRGYHRMACAIEDAGFEIRDSLMWVYGTGFPKSHDVSKGIDKLDAADMRRERQLRFTEWMRSTGLTSARIDQITGTNMGGHYTTLASQPAVATRDHFEALRPHFGCDVPQWVEAMVDERTVESENFKRREVVGEKSSGLSAGSGTTVGKFTDSRNERGLVDITVAHTPEAQAWTGWGTALKPAFEPIVLARKPLSEPTVAANVLRWRTGALNIGATRIGDEVRHAAFTSLAPCHGNRLGDADTAAARRGTQGEPKEYVGRWPANVVHDGSDEVVGAFPANAGAAAPASGKSLRGENTSVARGKFNGLPDGREPAFHADKGSAARFFYSAKASKADRAGSKHPTVKPVALMQWLARLVTPPGGVILDPFAGSGTTGAAALAEGFKAVLCEREDEYVADIRRRLGLAA